MSHFQDLPQHISVLIGRHGNTKECKLAPGLYACGEGRPVIEDCYPHLVEVAAPAPSATSLQHIKLQIFFHETFTRFVIPTANLVWYDYARIENSAFIYDLPVLQPGDPKPGRTHFGGMIARTLTELGIPRDYWALGLAVTDLDKTETAGIRLVLSTPGKWEMTDRKIIDEDVGHLMIARGLRELGLTVGKDEALDIECQGSSIGNYGSDLGDFLRRMYRSCLGLPFLQPFRPTTPFDRRKPPSRDAEPKQGTQEESKMWQPPHSDAVKIIFPSLDTVQGSWGGPEGGGTLFCEWDSWNKPDFPRTMMHDGLSKREGVLMHVKSILGNIRPSPGAPARATWLLVGSHNLTAGAWGRCRIYHRKGVETGRSLVINNYELSVILKLDSEEEGTELVSWKRPCAQYEPEQVPWMQRSWRKDVKAAAEEE